METDVAMALTDLLKTLVRFKSKDLTAFTHGIHKNLKVIILIYGAWFTAYGPFRKDLTQRFVFDDA